LTSELPYPKELIQSSIILLLHNISDPQERSRLTTGYLELANWQPGVGARQKVIDFSKTYSSGVDLGTMKEALDESLKQVQQINHWGAVIVQLLSMTVRVTLILQ
jgi:hypothetical protein